MARSGMLSMFFSVLLGATVVYAQDEAATQAVRFEPSVQILNLQNGTMLVKKANKELELARSYKAYPYGSSFELSDGGTCQLRFGEMTTVDLTGPAQIKVLQAEMFRRVILEVKTGEMKISVDTNAQPGQFTVLTPMGNFTSLSGLSKLFVGDIEGGTIEDGDFDFRVNSGTATFNGAHFDMGAITQANAFISGETKSSTIDFKEYHDTRLEGTSGGVDTALKAGADRVMNFSLTPGSVIKITRAKNPGSDNWVVSVLTLLGDGKAKNYFCYVENRGEEYATGELIDELLLDEESEEEDGEESDESGDDSGDEELL